MAGQRQRRTSRRKTTPAKGQTLLAYHRIRVGMTQAEVARRTGVPIATYRRLERGEIGNPRVGWLINCGYVLWIDPIVLLRDYDRWVPLPGGPKHPPVDPTAHHRPGRFTNLPELKKRRRVGT